MSHTLAANVADFTSQDYTPGQTIRITAMIAWAERYIARRAGWDFFDLNAPDGDQSRDWIECTCRVVVRMLLSDDPETQAKLAGPYVSERNADYQYTMRTTIREEDLRTDPAIDELIAYWSEVSPAVPAVLNVGPTSTKLEETRPTSLLDDVSRGGWPRDWLQWQ